MVLENYKNNKEAIRQIANHFLINQSIKMYQSSKTKIMWIDTINQ